jgi:DNA-binding beta-propeller fold protein YncE
MSTAMTGASSVAVSPDLGNVYVASAGNFGLGGGGLVLFERDRGTGALRLTGCIGDREGCDHSDSQGVAGAVAVSSDGRHVYVGGASGMVIYARDPGDGTVRRTTCVTDGRDPDDGCTHVQPFYGLGLFVPSPDGRHTYAASDGNTPVTYERDVSTGALSPLGCSAGLSWCASDFGSGPRMLAMSPDGRDLYGVGFSGFMNFAQQKGGSLFGFDRDPRSGALTPSQCFGPQLSIGPCVPTDKVRDPAGVAAAGDGRGVYVLSGGSDARIGTLTVFQRNPVNGDLDESGCLAQNGSRADCLGAFGLGAARSLAVSPDGRNVYVGAAARRIAGFGPAVAIDASTVEVGRTGAGALGLVCPHAAGRCRGLLVLRTAKPVAVRSGTRTRTRRVTVATTGFAVDGGRRSAVRLRLSRSGNQLLRLRRRLSVRATLTGSGAITAKTVRTLTLHRKGR